jgi:DnaK suppressor protein
MKENTEVLVFGSPCLKEVAKKLTARKKELIGRSKKEMMKGIAAECRQALGSGMEEGDFAMSSYADYMHFRGMDSHRLVMLQIDRALQKIEDGSYGMCEECEIDIDRERLRVLPFALYCRSCQAILERGA